MFFGERTDCSCLWWSSLADMKHCILKKKKLPRCGFNYRLLIVFICICLCALYSVSLRFQLFRLFYTSLWCCGVAGNQIPLSGRTPN